MQREWHAEATQLDGLGVSWRAIATQLGIPRSTVSDFLRKGPVKPAEKLSYDGRAKVLFIDLESAPTSAYIWKRWKENIGLSQDISEGYLLTYSAKWHGEDLMMSNRIHSPEDDRALTLEIAELFEQADVIVAHNAKRFDVPLTLTRMLYNGLVPPSPYKVVDTLEIAKKVFKFPSNSLDSLASYLGLDRKIHHEGFDLWKKCTAGEDEAFETMLEYNRQDVVVLEQVYEKLAPWYSQHPNLSVYYNDGQHHCPLCGSTDFTEVDKHAFTQQSEFYAYRCNHCNKISRSKKSLRSKESMAEHFMNVV